MLPIDSRSIAFIPVSSSGGSSSTLPSSVYKNVNTNVLELVIPATSPDCPHPLARQPHDGHFHTGDLFLEVLPGHYSFRGRLCEWIKGSTGCWYDAKCVCVSIPHKRGNQSADHHLSFSPFRFIQGDRREHTQELSRPHRRMHRCWKRATLTRTSDRTQSWRCNAGRWRFDQTGGVQTDTTFPIEKVGSREDQIRGVARDCAAYRMA
jgi:hypothetical protein